MPVYVRSQRGPHGIPLGPLRTRARRMLAALDCHDRELSIVLVDDHVIRTLNSGFRNLDRPTDVLSFSMAEGEFGDVNPDVLGDVVISVPTARRQAARSKRTVFDEVTFLLAHGLLHLLGHDHATVEQDREMKALTRRLMATALDTRPMRNAHQ